MAELLLTLKYDALPGQDDPVECPICREHTRVCVSICDNRHWLCMPCFEQIVMRVELYCYLSHTDLAVPDAKSCPMCRQGCVKLSNVVEELGVAPKLLGSLSVYSHPATKDKPVHFRHRVYKNRFEAVDFALHHPVYVYESATDEDVVQLTTPECNTHDHAIQIIAEKSMICDICYRVMPREQCIVHFWTVHMHRSKETAYQLWPRRSIRLMEKTARQLRGT
jgi:hypothetical protein